MSQPGLAHVLYSSNVMIICLTIMFCTDSSLQDLQVKQQAHTTMQLPSSLNSLICCHLSEDENVCCQCLSGYCPFLESSELQCSSQLVAVLVAKKLYQGLSVAMYGYVIVVGETPIVHYLVSALS